MADPAIKSPVSTTKYLPASSKTAPGAEPFHIWFRCQPQRRRWWYTLKSPQNPIKKVFADKGYFRKENRDFLHMNNIEDGIMRKATRGTELTQCEKERNKAISKIRYIVEQYFGISHLYHHAHRARFTKMIRNAIDVKFRQLAFNLFRGTKVLKTA